MTLTTQCVTLALLVFVSASLVETRLNIRVQDSLIRRGNSDFATALYSKLTKTSSSSNIFFSPLSIQIILALAYVGARGKTAQQMAAGLHLTTNLKEVKNDFRQLLQGIANHSERSVTLEMANKIYLANRFHVKGEFNKVATQDFLSNVETVDFSLGEETARVINNWVKKKTHYKIRDIISKENLDSLTTSVLVNAVYFKGKWKHAFDKNLTRSSKFYVTPKRTRKIEIMSTIAKANLVKNDEIGANILELPYKGNSITLVVILPFKIDGLSKVENKLRSTNLKTIFASLRQRQTVRVLLPRFKLEESLPLDDHLKALGMTEMFKDSADFSGMSDSGSSVDKVLHKAFIEVNEEGSEAAAATAVVSTSRSNVPPPPPRSFVANHPFVFLLRHRKSGGLLFMGRFTGPE